jgi:hypothetical protein
MVDACAEKLRLTQEYDELTIAYSKAVAMLYVRITVLSGKQYKNRRKILEKAGEALVQARKQLDLHVGQHHC